jgi:hypothetical protein
MAAFIALSGEPFCADCRYSLQGSPLRGRCPECGGHYYLNIPEPRPGFLGLNRLRLSLRARARYALWRATPSLRAICIALFILGWTVVAIGFGAAALDKIGIDLFGREFSFASFWR